MAVGKLNPCIAHFYILFYLCGGCFGSPCAPCNWPTGQSSSRFNSSVAAAVKGKEDVNNRGCGKDANVRLDIWKWMTDGWQWCNKTCITLCVIRDFSLLFLICCPCRSHIPADVSPKWEKNIKDDHFAAVLRICVCLARQVDKLQRATRLI